MALLLLDYFIRLRLPPTNHQRSTAGDRRFSNTISCWSAFPRDGRTANSARPSSWFRCSSAYGKSRCESWIPADCTDANSTVSNVPYATCRELNAICLSARKWLCAAILALALHGDKRVNVLVGNLDSYWSDGSVFFINNDTLHNSINIEK